MKILQILLESGKGDLVAALILAVLCGFFLDGIVGEVDVLVAAVAKGELIAGCTNVSLGVEVG